ncbi:MAG: hypothetical protein ABH891_08990 [Candidatus Omnitrophota bacterium]
MKENLRKYGVSLMAAAFFVLLAAGSVDASTDKLSANQLVSEYKANEVAADEKYKGHVVTVSGIIGDIRKDSNGRTYVILDIHDQGFLTGVQCTFAEGTEPPAKRLSKGLIVTIKGEVTGKLGYVLLEKATLQ